MRYFIYFILLLKLIRIIYKNERNGVMIERIKQLTKELNNASRDYYNTGTSILSDAEFDYKLEELKKFEKETGFHMSNSPTNNVGYEVVTGQNKIDHVIPMLSLEKVHSAAEIIKFAEDKSLVAMFKMDGISIRATYNQHGDIIGLESRGNGVTGTDLFYQRYSFENLPLHIDVNEETIIDGEAIIRENDFRNINSRLSNEEQYSHSRNLAAGSLSLLDTSVSAKRHLRMVVWDVIQGYDCDNFDEKLIWAESKGFDIVNWICLESGNIDDINAINEQLFTEAKELGYGIDGVVWKYQSVSYGKTKGKTEHHFCNAVAYKAQQEVHRTILENIELQTSKTGVINPVAKFRAIDLGGALTTRSTLHNLNYIESLELGIGDEIGVIRSNDVIPRVVENYTRSNTWKYVKFCPVCGAPTMVKEENGTKTLWCTNKNDCPAQLLGKLKHFVSRDCMDINGLSEATLGKFISLGWINSFADIYRLYEHERELLKLDGFGKRSVEKLLQSIEDSKTTDLSHFLNALSIPNCGKGTCKDLSSYCNGDIVKFINIMSDRRAWKFKDINGIGDTVVDSLNKWWFDNGGFEVVANLTDNYIDVVKPEAKTIEPHRAAHLNGSYVITGSLHHFDNREQLVELITSLGGKVGSGVTSKTVMLINNEINSTSSKNKKAKVLGVPIVTEEQFLDSIGYTY